MNFNDNNTRQLNRDAVKQLSQCRWTTEILPACGVSGDILNGRHQPCPACGGKDCFRYTDFEGNGGYICNKCGHGDGFALLELVHGWRFAEALKVVGSVLGLAGNETPMPPARIAVPHLPVEGNTPDPKVQSYLDWLLASSEPIKEGSPPDLYLARRGLRLEEYPDVLRYHAGLNYKDRSNQLVGRFPALLGLVQSPDGQVVACQRIYLTIDGTKAPVEKLKKLTARLFNGAITGGAVRLFDATGTLGVAEGIETAIAAYLRWNIPTWAGVTAGGMQSIEIPAEVQHVYIFADNDSHKLCTGEIAASTLARRLVAEGRVAHVIRPRQAGFDIADLVKGI